MVPCNTVFKVFQIHVILTPVTDHPIDPPPIFLYGSYFEFTGPIALNKDNDLIPTPSPGTDMFMLCHQYRTDKTAVDDVIALTDMCKIVQLVPILGAKINPNLNTNTLDLVTDFYLNNFADKNTLNTFHAISSYLLVDTVCDC